MLELTANIETAISNGLQILARDGTKNPQYGENTAPSTCPNKNSVQEDHGEGAWILADLMELPAHEHLTLLLRLALPANMRSDTVQDLASFVVHHTGRAKISKEQAAYWIERWAGEEETGGTVEYGEAFGCTDRSGRSHRDRVVRMMEHWYRSGLMAMEIKKRDILKKVRFAA